MARQKTNADFIIREARNVMLSDIPRDVNRLIGKEQSRIDMHEDQKLKKHAVVYRMLREWYQQKNIIAQLREEIEKLKNKLVIE